jgi:hypothetical protein
MQERPVLERTIVTSGAGLIGSRLEGSDGAPSETRSSWDHLSDDPVGLRRPRHAERQAAGRWGHRVPSDGEAAGRRGLTL